MTDTTDANRALVQRYVERVWGERDLGQRSRLPPGGPDMLDLARQLGAVVTAGPNSDR